MITIRQARHADLTAILAIVGETVAQMAGYGNDQWDSEYPANSRFEADLAAGTLWVADAYGEVAGFIVADLHEPTEYAALTWSATGRAMVIHRFAVATGFRGRGIAATLEAHVVKLTEQAGLPLIKVDTHSSNAGMQKFLLAHGYRFAGEMSFQGKPRPFYCYDKMA